MKCRPHAKFRIRRPRPAPPRATPPESRPDRRSRRGTSGIALLGRIGQVGALAVVPYDDLRTTESLLLHLLLRRTRFVERTVPAGIVGVFPLDLFVSERIGTLEEVTAVGAVRIGAEQNPVDRSTLVDLYLPECGARRCIWPA